MATYEKTEDLSRMMTNKQLDEAILTDYENVKKVLPARTATHIEYENGAETALIWKMSKSGINTVVRNENQRNYCRIGIGSNPY